MCLRASNVEGWCVSDGGQSAKIGRENKDIGVTLEPEAGEGQGAGDGMRWW